MYIHRSISVIQETQLLLSNDISVRKHIEQFAYGKNFLYLYMLMKKQT